MQAVLPLRVGRITEIQLQMERQDTALFRIECGKALQPTVEKRSRPGIPVFVCHVPVGSHETDRDQVVERSACRMRGVVRLIRDDVRAFHPPVRGQRKRLMRIIRGVAVRPADRVVPSGGGTRIADNHRLRRRVPEVDADRHPVVHRLRRRMARQRRVGRRIADPSDDRIGLDIASDEMAETGEVLLRLPFFGAGRPGKKPEEQGRRLFHGTEGFKRKRGSRMKI